MSSLSSDVRVVYVPVLYDLDDKLIKEGCDCYDDEEAEEEGRDLVAAHVRDYSDKYCYCVIQKRIVPTWE